MNLTDRFAAVMSACTSVSMVLLGVAFESDRAVLAGIAWAVLAVYFKIPWEAATCGKVR